MKYLLPVWTPQDAAEVFQRAATYHAGCPASLTQLGERFDCEESQTHITHVSAALGARWVDVRDEVAG